MGLGQDEPDEVDDESASDAVSTVVAPHYWRSSFIFDLYTKARNMVWPINLPINADGQCTFADHYRMSCKELDAEDALLSKMHDELQREPLWSSFPFVGRGSNPKAYGTILIGYLRHF